MLGGVGEGAIGLEILSCVCVRAYACMCVCVCVAVNEGAWPEKKVQSFTKHGHITYSVKEVLLQRTFMMCIIS